MKPGVVVADEMFPEGAGPYTDLEESAHVHSGQIFMQYANQMMLAGGSGGLLMDLAANEKSVHADFFNDFDDLFDDEDLQ